MTRPEDIPEDVWAGAWAWWQPHRKSIPNAAIELIARGVMAERERAADCAEAMLRLGFALPGEEQLVSLIASAIRSTSP